MTVSHVDCRAFLCVRRESAGRGSSLLGGARAATAQPERIRATAVAAFTYTLRVTRAEMAPMTV
jgi:hypothetical protein